MILPLMLALTLAANASNDDDASHFHGAHGGEASAVTGGLPDTRARGECTVTATIRPEHPPELSDTSCDDDLEAAILSALTGWTWTSITPAPDHDFVELRLRFAIIGPARGHGTLSYSDLLIGDDAMADLGGEEVQAVEWSEVRPTHRAQIHFCVIVHDCVGVFAAAHASASTTVGAG